MCVVILSSFLLIYLKCMCRWESMWTVISWSIIHNDVIWFYPFIFTHGRINHTWAITCEIWRKFIRFSALSRKQTQYETSFANEVQATTVTNIICTHNKTLSPIITVTALISSATEKMFGYALVRWCWEFLYTLTFSFCTHSSKFPTSELHEWYVWSSGHAQYIHGFVANYHF